MQGAVGDLAGLIGLPFSERIGSFYGYLEERRAAEAVGPSEQTGVWEVFGYDQAVQVLGDHETFSSDMNEFIPEDQQQLARAAQGNFVGIDPPRHTQLRGLVNRALTPQMMAGLEAGIAKTAEQLLDRIAVVPGEPAAMDAVTDFASPLTATVIAELFGIPESDYPMFSAWAGALMGTKPPEEMGIADEAAMGGAADLVRQAAEYLSTHIRDRRARPGTDLTSALVLAEVDGQTLNDDEIVGVIGMFLIAGHLPASLLIANTLMCLDEHPGAFAEVCRTPEALRGAIEEVLRWRPPLVRDQRITTRETALGGRILPARSMVCVWLASAHRDASRFERPDEFDIRRGTGRHLAFGKGIHYCLGAALSRLETRIAITALLNRYDRIRVDRDRGVKFHSSIGVMGPARLPVSVWGR